MAVVTVKSTQITNRDTTPVVLTNATSSGGHIRESAGEVVITSGNSVGSIYQACTIPSNARIKRCLVSAPDIGTTTTADVGLYKTTADGGAVVDVDFFDDALSLKDGAIARTDVTFANVITLANYRKPVWEQLGLSSDPGINYDVCLTLDGAADGTGTALVEVEYVV